MTSGTPAPKKSSTGLKVVTVIGAIFVLGLLTCGAAAFWVYQQPAFRDALDAVMQAENNPGAPELRAAGCSQAMVMDVSATLEAAQQLVGEDSEFPDTEDVPRYVVSCTLGSTTSMDCAEVARIFLAATPEPDGFVAQVNDGSGGLVCQTIYAADGTPQGSPED